MKKTNTKRLMLNRETLRALDTRKLAAARGGQSIADTIKQIGTAIVSAVEGSCGEYCTIV